MIWWIIILIFLGLITLLRVKRRGYFWKARDGRKLTLKEFLSLWRKGIDGITALQIVKIDSRYGWQHGVKATRKKRLPRPNEYADKKKKLAKKPAVVREMMREANAARVKSHRDRMTEKEKEKYKMEARKRAAKSRRNRKRAAKRRGKK